MRFLITAILVSIATLYFPPANAQLNKIPDVADTGTCDLGATSFADTAAAYAKKKQLKEPPGWWAGAAAVTDSMDILGEKALDECKDGQMVITTDPKGYPAFAQGARSLLKKLCSESDIESRAAPEINKYASRLSCKVTKLEQIKKAMRESKKE